MALGLVIVTLAAVPSAWADTESELADARARLAQINEDVQAQLDTIADLKAESGAMASDISAAEGRLEEAEAQLDETAAAVRRAERRYGRLQDRLAKRVTELYIAGPGSGFDFLLGASSMADLADRLEYSSTVAQADTDLANEVENLRIELVSEQQRQEEIVTERSDAYGSLQGQMAALQDRFDQQGAAYQKIVDDRAEAEAIVADLHEKHQAELAAQVPPPPPPTNSAQPAPPPTDPQPPTGSPSGSNPLLVCPVGDPHAIADGFGAPRYGGGYHLHAGDDIIAPEGTPIYATFDGVARDASNSLGGLSVVVQGSLGYTYNAHMVSISRLGTVSAGDVIGLVGATGDTSTPHNHFEWHPNVVPSDWPASPYGVSVIGSAVNPYPLLAAVC